MDEIRFNAAVTRALLRERDGGGIGMLGEKTLHSALKYYYEPNALSHEQKAGGYFADIKNEEGIIEVQTGSLGALRPKLLEYLKTTDVTVVHPVIRRKTIIWIDEKTLEAKRSRSTRAERPEDAFRQIMYLGPLPANERLKIALPILDIDEQRLVKYGRRGRKTFEKLDKIPTALIDEIILTCPEDYLYFVPEALLSKPAGFTAAELVKHTKYKEPSARALLYTLMNMGLIKRERKGRSYIYSLIKTEQRN